MKETYKELQDEIKKLESELDKTYGQLEAIEFECKERLDMAFSRMSEDVFWKYPVFFQNEERVKDEMIAVATRELTLKKDDLLNSIALMRWLATEWPLISVNILTKRLSEELLDEDVTELMTAFSKSDSVFPKVQIDGVSLKSSMHFSRNPKIAIVVRGNKINKPFDIQLDLTKYIEFIESD